MLNLNGVTSMCRGAFIVFEGCDRCGKTTQSKLLVEYLQKQGKRVQHMAFPARQSNIGKVINSYLTNKQDIPDECIHLLFTANRWEFKHEMKRLLEAGTTLVVDRYCYSGVAYSTAKGFNYDWCMAPEKGLIRPDLVFYLKSSLESLAARGNYGEERYEKLDFQKKVAEVFNRISEEESSYWHVLDAIQAPEVLAKNISEKTEIVVKTVANIPIKMI